MYIINLLLFFLRIKKYIKIQVMLYKEIFFDEKEYISKKQEKN